MHLSSLLPPAVLAAVATASNANRHFALLPRETGAATETLSSSSAAETSNYRDNPYFKCEDEVFTLVLDVTEHSLFPTHGPALSSYFDTYWSNYAEELATRTDITRESVEDMTRSSTWFCSKYYAPTIQWPAGAPPASLTQAASEFSSFEAAYSSYLSVIRPTASALASTCAEFDNGWFARSALVHVAENYDECIRAVNLQMGPATAAATATATATATEYGASGPKETSSSVAAAPGAKETQRAVAAAVVGGVVGVMGLLWE
ncbi:hypothetical protein QBC35DRAFT_455275 [Podospora australis]|uniref:Uncharacterized protein n=1 Tax=Podospora australis TaxID=1536484 RepID=A0AAN6WMM0_9PEZI|nr:hypothetical protein QBC35DRAFT_455275 [Podospora australis]